MAKLIRCLSDDGLVSISVIDSTDIAAKAEQIHKSSAVVTAALGRLLTATSLMGAQLKSEGNSVTVRVNGDGPIGSMTAISDYMGNVRGCVTNPIVELPLNSVGKLDVGGAVGKGDMFVTKDLGLREPYNGAIELISGEIAEDIAAYFAQSEQIPTVCGLGVLVNPDLTVNCAGGYLIQLLPAAGEDTITKVEQSISGIESVTQMMSRGLGVFDIAKNVLSKFNLELLDESEPMYKCNCSRERTVRMLRSIGKDELAKLAGEQELTKVCCHFCNKEYDFTSDELKSIAENLK
mgnify:FL=1